MNFTCLRCPSPRSRRFQQWPGDALEAVAFKLLREVEGLDEATRASLVKLCQAFHSRVTDASVEFKTELGRCAAPRRARVHRPTGRNMGQEPLRMPPCTLRACMRAMAAGPCGGVMLVPELCAHAAPHCPTD